MELEKAKNHDEKSVNKNENIQKEYIMSIKDRENEDETLNQNLDNIKNTFNIVDIRKYMNNNNMKITDQDEHLMTDINKNRFSRKNNTSLSSSNNDDNDLVMNQNYNYNYNPISSSNNNSSAGNNIISEPNNYYSSQKEKHSTSSSIYDNMNCQYYSEQKVFNPGLLFDYSTKKSTRSSISRHGDEYQEKIVESKNNNNYYIIDDNNQNNVNNLSSNSYCNNKGRSSLVKMVNEYCDNNTNDEDNYLDENIKDNKMTMNSFDSSQNEKIKQNKNKENNNDDNDDNVINYNMNTMREKTMNSEKMNLNQEEISKLLNNEKKNENEESQISMNYYITSKNKKQEEYINNNNISNNKNNNKISSLKQNENIKIKVNNNGNKINEKNVMKISKQKNKDINENKNEIIKEEKQKNKNKNKIIENFPFQGSYIDYKQYERYILDNNHEELLNTGDDEDIFGKYIDKIIQRSYHIYTNRQCPSCANLLTNGKSCAKCPKFHHLIKAGNNKRNKIKK